MKFQEFYYTKHPEQKKIDDVIQEMSMQIPSVGNKLQGPLNYEYLDTVLKNGLFIETWTDANNLSYDIFSYKREDEPFDTLYFTYNKQLIAAMIEIDIDANTVYIKEAYGIGGRFKGLVSTIYVDYFLKKYEALVSDRIHTIEGFGIYRYFVNNLDKLGISVAVENVQTEEVTPIYEISELEKYFGKAHTFSLYRFIVRKK